MMLRRTFATLGWLFGLAGLAKAQSGPLPQQQIFLLTKIPIDQWEKWLNEAKEAGLKHIDARFSIGFQGLRADQVELLIDRYIRLDSKVNPGSFRLWFYEVNGRRSFEVRQWK